MHQGLYGAMCCLDNGCTETQNSSLSLNGWTLESQLLTWMDLELVILSEVSQTEKEKYRMPSLLCGV